MINPFNKNNNKKALIGGVIAGSAIVGTVAYLFFSKNGMSVRQQFGGYLKRLKGRGSAENNRAAKPATDYLHHKMKAPKTDRENLFKHNILKHGPTDINDTPEPGTSIGDVQTTANNI